MQQIDPYPDIKQEVERELEEAAKLQADLFAGKRAAAEQLKYQFNNVTEQLAALEGAVKLMVDNSERFQLERTTAYARQVEVETLRWQLQDIQATCAQVESSDGDAPKQRSVTFSEVEMHKMPNGDVQHHRKGLNSSDVPLRHSKLRQQQHKEHTDCGASSSSTRPPDISPASAIAAKQSSSSKQQPLLPISTPPFTAAAAAAGVDTRNGWDTGDWDSYEDVMQQQIADQDQNLDHISIHVDRIKQTGQAMNDELEEQALLLGGLESDTESSQMKLKGLRRKVADVIKRSRNNRQLCLILALSVVLVVVTLIAIA